MFLNTIPRGLRKRQTAKGRQMVDLTGMKYHEAISALQTENERLCAELAQVREILGDRENIITSLRTQRDQLLAAFDGIRATMDRVAIAAMEENDAIVWRMAHAAIAAVEER